MLELRTPVMTIVEASWEDSGGSLQTTRARMEDRSISGACIRVKAPVAVGAKLKIQWRFEQFFGTARYCRTTGTEYLVGIQRDLAATRGEPPAFTPLAPIHPKPLPQKALIPGPVLNSSPPVPTIRNPSFPPHGVSTANQIPVAVQKANSSLILDHRGESAQARRRPLRRFATTAPHRRSRPSRLHEKLIRFGEHRSERNRMLPNQLLKGNLCNPDGSNRLGARSQPTSTPATKPV